MRTPLSPSIPRRSTNGQIRALLVALGLASCLALSGCDKCGDWFWQGSTKACRDQSQVK